MSLHQPHEGNLDLEQHYPSFYIQVPYDSVYYSWLLRSLGTRRQWAATQGTVNYNL